MASCSARIRRRWRALRLSAYSRRRCSSRPAPTSLTTDLEGVAGRLRKGSIRAGDIYALESWQDSVAVVELKGSNLSATLLEELRNGGAELNPRGVYTVATTAYVAGELAAEKLGRVESSQRRGLVRDATIAYLRKRGFSAVG